jgi:hypothetical protein
MELEKIEHIKWGLREVIARIEPCPICHHCQSVIQPGDKEFEDEDGNPLCWECYAELYAERDRADEWLQRGDILYDRQRGN